VRPPSSDFSLLRLLKEIPTWARRLAAEAEIDPRLGSLRRIGPEARLRGLLSVEKGELFSLGRPLEGGTGQSHTGREAFAIEVSVRDNEHVTEGVDRIELDCHGLGVTHLDALNHFGVDGRWYGGVDARAPKYSVADLAAVGVVTRGIFLDVPRIRATDWVDIDRPASADDFDRALEAVGVDIEPGDALIVYMGRDRYEPARGPLKPIARSPEGRPGIGTSGAAWIARQPISALLWDMLDAHGGQEDPLSVHLLLWAQGLVLVDNCDLGAASAAIAAKREKTCLVMVAPLNIPKGTGSAVNPLLMV
jgi:kynurenine formamidase